MVCEIGNSAEPPPWFGKALQQMEEVVNHVVHNALKLRLDKHDMSLGEVQDALGMVYERLGSVEHRFDGVASLPASPGTASSASSGQKHSFLARAVPDERPSTPVISLSPGKPLASCMKKDSTTSSRNLACKVLEDAPADRDAGEWLEGDTEEEGAVSRIGSSRESKIGVQVMDSIQLGAQYEPELEKVYMPKKCWVIASEKRQAAPYRPNMNGADGLNFNMLTEEMVKEDKGFTRHLITNPESMRRFFWDIIGMLLICYDIVTIPLQFFGIDVPDPMAYFACVFWTCDFAQAWFLGFYIQGRLELRFKYIVINYLHSWFLFDVSIVASDWATIVVKALNPGVTSEGSQFGSISKSLRIIRTMRSLRLLRLVKIKRALDKIKERITSDLIRTLFNIFGLMMLIVTINHIVACCWYGLSEHNFGLGFRSWVGAHIHNRTFAIGDDYRKHEVGFSYKYVTALHWSLTQFTPASMEITPRNTNERFFTVMIILFALVVFSSFVSSLTSAMTRYQNMRSERDRQFDLLRRFLRDKHVGHLLAMRVTRYIEHSLAAATRNVEDKDVDLLKILSEPLRMDLWQEIFGPILSAHPFFAFYAAADPGAMKKLCYTCVAKVSLSFGDSLFNIGEPSTKMYFLLDGKLQYTPAEHLEDMFRNSSSNNDEQQVIAQKPSEKNRYVLHPGMWCSEASLWTQWSHQGIMQSMGISTIIVLDAEKFAQVTSSHVRVAPHAGAYGEAFVKELNKLARQRELSDLPVFDAEGLVEEVIYNGQDPEMSVSVSEARLSRTQKKKGSLSSSARSVSFRT